MQICEIKYDTADAAENMAIDAVMLEHAGTLGEVIWRLYGWDEQAITFGYSQTWSWIKTYMQKFDGACIRRMTGGGIVDHRHDLTYALAIPSAHPFYRDPAPDLYRDLHQHIAEIFLDLGIAADLAPCRESCSDGTPVAASGVCFERAEPFDVINKLSRVKLAGAAMKRNQSGILIQGSLSMLGLPGLSIDGFECEFGGALCRWLDGDRVAFKGTLPVARLIEEQVKFASDAWNKKR